MFLLVSFATCMHFVEVLIDQPSTAKLRKRLVNADQRLPRRISRADSKLPADRLHLLGGVDRREAAGSLADRVELKLTARVRFQAAGGLILVGLGARLQGTLGRRRRRLGLFRTLFLGLFALHVVAVICG